MRDEKLARGVGHAASTFAIISLSCGADIPRMDGESRSREFCVTANWRLPESLRNFRKGQPLAEAHPCLGRVLLLGS